MSGEEVYNVLLVRGAKNIKPLRRSLEECGYYDNSRCIQQLSLDDRDMDPQYALPISQSSVQPLQTTNPHTGTILAQAHLPQSKKSRANQSQPSKILRDSIRIYLEQFGSKYSDEEIKDLLSDLPGSWERHCDMVVLPGNSFSDLRWTKDHHFKHTQPDCSTGATCTSLKQDTDQLWKVIAKALNCERLAIDGKVLCDQFRSSGAVLLLGQDGWVTHVDNGIRYVFDVTKCMFSSGNINEKVRVAKLDCRGETVVDLYAGVGYFTLPYLVHAGAALVHACEWNPHAVEALERGLEANGVRDRCVIHRGDNRQLPLVGVAERVNLGLVPSSEAAWPIACRVLNSTTGGWLHIHGNVSSKRLIERHSELNQWELVKNTRIASAREPTKELTFADGSNSSDTSSLEEACHSLDKEELGSLTKTEIWWKWTEYVRKEITALLCKENSLSDDKQWNVVIGHLEHVKSYAPHVDHLVVDLECRPFNIAV